MKHATLNLVAVMVAMLLTMAALSPVPILDNAPWYIMGIGFILGIYHIVCFILHLRATKRN